MVSQSIEGLIYSRVYCACFLVVYMRAQLTALYSVTHLANHSHIDLIVVFAALFAAPRIKQRERERERGGDHGN